MAGEAVHLDRGLRVPAVLTVATGSLRFLGPMRERFGAITITPDGRYAAYVRYRKAWCVRCGDVYVRDLRTGTERLVSITPQGQPSRTGNQNTVEVSADGQHVTFTSSATDLVPGTASQDYRTYVHDVGTGRTELVAAAPSPFSRARLSRDGSRITFTKEVTVDGQAVEQAFVWDRKTDVVTRLSFPANGEPPNGSTNTPYITPDGRLVAFTSQATNLVPGGAIPGSTYTRSLSAP